MSAFCLRLGTPLGGEGICPPPNQPEGVPKLPTQLLFAYRPLFSTFEPKTGKVENRNLCFGSRLGGGYMDPPPKFMVAGSLEVSSHRDRRIQSPQKNWENMSLGGPCGFHLGLSLSLSLSLFLKGSPPNFVWLLTGKSPV